ncbi:MAG: hypothetical protein ACI9AR_000166 [Flavobacteriaceae bacterium]|jgi:hypothetical protein
MKTLSETAIKNVNIVLDYAEECIKQDPTSKDVVLQEHHVLSKGKHIITYLLDVRDVITQVFDGYDVEAKTQALQKLGNRIDRMLHVPHLA